MYDVSHAQVTVIVPEWWNWQTRRIQNPFLATECEFESHLGHHLYAVDQLLVVAMLQGASHHRSSSEVLSLHLCGASKLLKGQAYMFPMLRILHVA